jgi:methyl-accepting chemotaxis protein
MNRLTEPTMFFRKKAEDTSLTTIDPQRLAELEGQIDAINRSQAVIEFTLDGIILRANEHFCTTLGYREDEIKGQHHRLFVRPADQGPAYDAFWQKLARGEYDSAQYLRIGKGGRDVWIQASYNPVFDADSKPFKVVKYATDITDQVRLRQEAATLSLVANETDNSVVITDAHGHIEYVNAGFTRLTGYTAAEALGRKPGELLQGKHTDADAKRRIREKLDAQQPFSDEILNYNKAGASYWISLAINPVFDAQRQLTKFVSIQTDVTASKLQQLDFNTRLEAISRSSAIIEFTPDGHVLTANANFCATMGYTADELKGQHHRLFADPAYAASSDYRAFWDKLGRGEFDAGKYMRVAKGGREVWLQASYNPIFDQNKRVTKVIKFANDITAQEVAAREQQQAVTEASRVMAALADGNLVDLMDGEYAGELGSLKESINSCVLNLRNMVNQINEAAHSIGTSAGPRSRSRQPGSEPAHDAAGVDASQETAVVDARSSTGTVAQIADSADAREAISPGAARGQAARRRAAAAWSRAPSAAMSEINQSSEVVSRRSSA